MRMRTSGTGVGLLIGLVALGMILLGSGAAEAQAKQKLSMGTATIGGLYYIFGGAWAKALNEAVPEVDITAESTPGSVANSQMIQAGKVAIGFSQATAAYEAFNGIGRTKGKKYDKIRALVALYPAALTVYTLESRNIRTLQDLNGKDVSLGPAGAGVDQFGRNLFEVLGIKPKRIHNLPHEQTAKAVGDGQLDAGMTVQLAPWPGLKDLETTHKLHFLPVTKDEVTLVKQGVFGDLKYSVATIAWDNSYPTGGESLTPEQVGLKTILGSVDLGCSAAATLKVDTRYDRTNS